MLDWELPGQHGLRVRVCDLPPTLPIVLPLCRRLQIARLVDDLLPMKDGDHLTHGQVTEFLILHILQAPHRLPLYELADWAAEHHVQALYGQAPHKFNDDRVGRTLEALAEVTADLETAVVTRALTQFDIPVRAIHWDLFSVVFNDAKQASQLINTGYGGGTIHRRQVHLSLHTSDDGAIPLRHELLPGKAHQAPHAQPMLHDLQQRLHTSNLIVVSDRAGVSYDNIVAYRAAGAHFVGLLPHLPPRLKGALGALPEPAFTPLRYHSMNAPENDFHYYATSIQLQPQRRGEPITVAALFVLNERLRQGQGEQRDKQMAKAQARLEEIHRHLQAPDQNQRRYSGREFTQRQIDKAIGELTAIVRYELSGEPGAWRLRWWIDEAARAQAALGDGRYILVHDVPAHYTPDEIFELQRRQGRIEARFRNFSQELSVHPLWLQKEARIIGLLLVFVLALLVYCLLEWLSERAGLDTPHYHKMTAREMMKRFRRLQLVEVRMRGQPVQRTVELNDEQRYILRALGFISPIRYLP